MRTRWRLQVHVPETIAATKANLKHLVRKISLLWQMKNIFS